jgi:hypothetical protein
MIMTVLYTIQSLCQPNYGYGKEEQDDDQRGGLMGEWHRALKGKDYRKKFVQQKEFNTNLHIVNNSNIF